MHLCALRVSKQLYEDVLDLLLLCNIMSKSRRYWAIESHGPAVSLLLISGGRQVLDSRVGALLWGELADELRTIVC